MVDIKKEFFHWDCSRSIEFLRRLQQRFGYPDFIKPVAANTIHTLSNGVSEEFNIII